MRKGTCLLCGKEKELVKISHIIPKCMYKGMENDKNKIGLSILKNNIKTETEIDYRYFDKYILCLDCERVRLSNWIIMETEFYLEIKKKMTYLNQPSLNI